VLALHGNTLFVGGRFDTIAAEPRANLGALDATTGAVLSWNPDMRGGFSNPFDVVSALTLADDVLYVGGRFTRIGGYPWRGLAALSLARVSAQREEEGAESSERVGQVPFALTPNPSRGSMRLAFTLSSPATVSLRVFDMAGRRVAIPLEGSFQRAGNHT